MAAYRVTGDKPELAGPPVAVGGSGPTHLGLLRRARADRQLRLRQRHRRARPRRRHPRGRRVSGVLRHTGSGPHPARQQGPHAHQVQPDPSGRWVVSVDLGTDSVRVCAPARRRPRRCTARPRCAPAPDRATWPSTRRGAYAYVLNELAPTVTVCRWDAAEGLLKPLARDAGAARAPRTATPTPRASSSSPDGRFVWTADTRRRTSCPCSPSTTPGAPAAGRRPCPAAATGPARSPRLGGIPVRRPTSAPAT